MQALLLCQEERPAAIEHFRAIPAQCHLPVFPLTDEQLSFAVERHHHAMWPPDVGRLARREFPQIGEQIIVQFPNTRMAEEVRQMIDGLRDRAASIG